MIMNTALVHMSADNEGMILFEESLSKLVAHLIGLFRCYLPILEGLTHLISNYISVLLSPGKLEILPLG